MLDGMPGVRGGSPRRAAPGRGFAGRPALIILGAAVPMAEAAAVSATVPSARVLAPEVTALAPLAVFHDLRWLFGFGGTWPLRVDPDRRGDGPQRAGRGPGLAGLAAGAAPAGAAAASTPRPAPAPAPAAKPGPGDAVLE